MTGSIVHIQTVVAKRYRIGVLDMKSNRRARDIARPRQIAMYLCRRLTIFSMPEIGRHFGGRDHTTVVHAVHKIEQLCEADPQFSREVELLQVQLAMEVREADDAAVMETMAAVQLEKRLATVFANLRLAVRADPFYALRRLEQLSTELVDKPRPRRGWLPTVFAKLRHG